MKIMKYWRKRFAMLSEKSRKKSQADIHLENYNWLLQELLQRPFVQGIESTNNCTVHCKICPYSKMTREKGNIDEETFKLAVRNVVRYSAEPIITLHHFGDPILHPHLSQLINYAASQGLTVTLSTLGERLNERKIEQIANSHLSVMKFSFWGTNRVAFEEVQQASFDKTTENINKFIERAKNTKIVIELLTNWKANLQELPFYNQWKPYLQEKRIGGWSGDDEGVNQYLGYTQTAQSVPCGKLWKSQLKILWNGDVVPCCFDYDGKAVVGNIKEQNLQEIWLGEKMNVLRQLMLEGKRDQISLCRYCPQTTWKRPSREALLS